MPLIKAFEARKVNEIQAATPGLKLSVAPIAKIV